MEAGADLDFRREREDGGKSNTPLIGAASLGTEEAGLRLLSAGARPELRGLFGETALHWASLLGEERLAAALIAGSDLNLKDGKYHSTPLGWAMHGCYNPPAGNHGRQREGSPARSRRCGGRSPMAGIRACAGRCRHAGRAQHWDTPMSEIRIRLAAQRSRRGRVTRNRSRYRAKVSTSRIALYSLFEHSTYRRQRGA